MRRLAARGQLPQQLQQHRRQLKRGLLVSPKPHWPRFDGGLGMEIAGLSAGGQQMFRYTHSYAYEAVQELFEDSQVTLCERYGFQFFLCVKLQRRAGKGLFMHAVSSGRVAACVIELMRFGRLLDTGVCFSTLPSDRDKGVGISHV
jgi:hypothetical protein